MHHVLDLLSRNPFTDRTTEKTFHDGSSLYIHSDLRGFKPNDTTYVFFGKRGSGKTTIRLQMEQGYKQYNEAAVASGSSRGHFVVDLCRPGHMTACLTTFQVNNTDLAVGVDGLSCAEPAMRAYPHMSY